MKIIHNKILCLKCGDVIESKFCHDFKKCACGACAVDGGTTYLRRLGNRDDWQEMSEMIVALQKEIRSYPKSFIMMAQDKIENLQAQVSNLQLQNQLAGVVRYPMNTMYGVPSPCFNGCGCGC